MSMQFTPAASQLLALAARLVPADFLNDVKRSLRVPQLSPHHREGPFMDEHLVLVLAALEQVARGEIDERVHEAARELMLEAVSVLGIETCQQYVLLHDLDKANCLTLTYENGRKVAISWDEWKGMFAGQTGEELESFCQEEGIVQISYFQETPDGTRKHGAVTAERLRGRDDIPSVVVDAIGEHEMCFTFGARGGINIPLMEKLGEGKNRKSFGFMLAVNYADQMGSLKDNGEPDLSDFLLMVDSFVALGYLTALRDEFVIARRRGERFDDQAVEKALAVIRKDVNAFQSETVEQAFERIASQTRLPEVSEGQVLEALSPAIAEGLPQEFVEAIVAEMTTSGKLSSETGKRLGRFNRLVRPALAKLG